VKVFLRLLLASLVCFSSAFARPSQPSQKGDFATSSFLGKNKALLEEYKALLEKLTPFTSQQRKFVVVHEYLRRTKGKRREYAARIREFESALAGYKIPEELKVEIRVFDARALKEVPRFSAGDKLAFLAATLVVVGGAWLGLKYYGDSFGPLKRYRARKGAELVQNQVVLKHQREVHQIALKGVAFPNLQGCDVEGLDVWLPQYLAIAAPAVPSYMTPDSDPARAKQAVIDQLQGRGKVRVDELVYRLESAADLGDAGTVDALLGGEEEPLFAEDHLEQLGHILFSHLGLRPGHELLFDQPRGRQFYTDTLAWLATKTEPADLSGIATVADPNLPFDYANLATLEGHLTSVEGAIAAQEATVKADKESWDARTPAMEAKQLLDIKNAAERQALRSTIKNLATEIAALEKEMARSGQIAAAALQLQVDAKRADKTAREGELAAKDAARVVTPSAVAAAVRKKAAYQEIASKLRLVVNYFKLKQNPQASFAENDQKIFDKILMFATASEPTAAGAPAHSIEQQLGRVQELRMKQLHEKWRQDQEKFHDKPEVLAAKRKEFQQEARDLQKDTARRRLFFRRQREMGEAAFTAPLELSMEQAIDRAIAATDPKLFAYDDRPANKRAEQKKVAEAVQKKAKEYLEENITLRKRYAFYADARRKRAALPAGRQQERAIRILEGLAREGHPILFKMETLQLLASQPACASVFGEAATVVAGKNKAAAAPATYQRALDFIKAQAEGEVDAAVAIEGDQDYDDKGDEVARDVNTEKVALVAERQAAFNRAVDFAQLAGKAYSWNSGLKAKEFKDMVDVGVGLDDNAADPHGNFYYLDGRQVQDRDLRAFRADAKTCAELSLKFLDEIEAASDEFKTVWAEALWNAASVEWLVKRDLYTSGRFSLEKKFALFDSLLSHKPKRFDGELFIKTFSPKLVAQCVADYRQTIDRIHPNTVGTVIIALAADRDDYDDIMMASGDAGKQRRRQYAVQERLVEYVDAYGRLILKILEMAPRDSMLDYIALDDLIVILQDCAEPRARRAYTSAGAGSPNNFVRGLISLYDWDALRANAKLDPLFKAAVLDPAMNGIRDKIAANQQWYEENHEAVDPDGKISVLTTDSLFE